MSSPSGVKGFLFADLRDYTAFVEQHGDQAAAELLARFRQLVRAEIAGHSGAEIKTEGDSFFIVFPSVSAAIRGALDTVSAAQKATEANPNLPIRVGIGIHAGETADTPEGAVGGAINIAARVAAQAKAYEVVVTDVVRGLTRTSVPYGFLAIGSRRLKGVAEPVPLYLVRHDRITARPRTFATHALVVAGVAIVAIALLAVAALNLGGSIGGGRPAATTSANTALSSRPVSSAPPLAEPTATASEVSSPSTSAPSGTLPLETVPLGRFSPAMVDIPGDAVLMFGGLRGSTIPFSSRSDVWRFEPAPGWTRLTGELLIGHGIDRELSIGQPFYDAATGLVWIHANTTDGSQIWTYDYRQNEWERMPTNQGPMSTIAGSLTAFDAQSRQLIIFGGQIGASGFVGPRAYSDQTWSFGLDSGVFRQMQPAARPIGRRSGAMAYDASADRILLFGGRSEGSHDDTWAYDFDNDTWTEMAPASAPLAIWDAGVTYEPQGQKVLLFGGDGMDRRGLAGTWAYSFAENAWSQLTPSGTPRQRAQPGMVYEADTGLIVLFGGGLYGTPSGLPLEFWDDTWRYDPVANTWTEWSR